MIQRGGTQHFVFHSLLMDLSSSFIVLINVLVNTKLLFSIPYDRYPEMKSLDHVAICFEYSLRLFLRVYIMDP